MLPKIISFSLNYLNKKQNVIDFFAALLVFTLPVSNALPNIFLVGLTMAVVLNYKKIAVTKAVPVLLYASSILWLIVLFLFQFTGNEMDIYGRYFTSVLLLGLFTQTKNRRLIELFFLAGLTTATIGSYLAIVFYKFEHPTFILDIGDEINQLLWVERPYFGFMLALGVLLGLKNIEKDFKSIVFLFLIAIYTAFSIYISARLSILLIITAILLFSFKSKHIGFRAKLLVSGLFVGIILISLTFSKGLMSRMFISANVDNKVAWIKDYEPRFVIWPCSFELITKKMSILSGFKNYGEVRENLSACYYNSIDKLDKREYYLQKKFNTHNQFLDFFMIGGFLPFLLLISIFIYVWCFGKYSFETKLLFLFFFAFFFVENVLYRQLGCYFFGIFTSLYLKENLEKN